ncbi:hypothetical protein FNF29_06742 [Cafeteria roenbergensis]|uniref:histidine kinase n=1 Tax=Cafeteria roenbergensis TaxID=33653 RepID=A0A5A8C697_CAFRO|nr:hypothetical protein FNF29_06742 [Cafeteria roenbergensis]|eukprot:KAA0148355.1 hypothetical protein FNF29_06742 [Cafeteria roenbergensis]
MLNLRPGEWEWLAMAPDGRHLSPGLSVHHPAASQDQLPKMEASPVAGTRWGHASFLVACVVVMALTMAAPAAVGARHEYLVYDGADHASTLAAVTTTAGAALVALAMVFFARGALEPRDRVGALDLAAGMIAGWIPVLLEWTGAVKSAVDVWQVIPGACMSVPVSAHAVLAVSFASVVAVGHAAQDRFDDVDATGASPWARLLALNALAVAFWPGLVSPWLLGSTAGNVFGIVAFATVGTLCAALFWEVIISSGRRVLLACSQARKRCCRCMQQRRPRLVRPSGSSEDANSSDDELRDKKVASAAEIVRLLIPAFVFVLLLVNVVAVIVSQMHLDGCPAAFADPTAELPSGVSYPVGFSRDAEARGRAVSNVMRWSSAAAFSLACVILVARAQEAMADKRSAASRASARNLRQTLRVLSHETRGPVNGAVLALSLLERSVRRHDNDEVEDLLGDLRVSLERTKRGLDSLLALQSAHASDKAASDVQWEWCAAHAVSLRQVRATMRGACAAEGVELALEMVEPCDDGQPGAPKGRLLPPGSPFLKPKVPSAPLDEASVAGLSQLGATQGIPELEPLALPAAHSAGSIMTGRRHQSSSQGFGGGLARAPPATPRRAAGLRRSSGRPRAVPSDPDGCRSLVPRWEVFVDADKVTAVCLNFVSNALKHAPAQGGSIALRVSLRVTGDLGPSLQDTSRPTTPASARSAVQGGASLAMQPHASLPRRRGNSRSRAGSHLSSNSVGEAARTSGRPGPGLPALPLALESSLPASDVDLVRAALLPRRAPPCTGDKAGSVPEQSGGALREVTSASAGSGATGRRNRTARVCPASGPAPGRGQDIPSAACTTASASATVSQRRGESASSPMGKQSASSSLRPTLKGSASSLTGKHEASAAAPPPPARDDETEHASSGQETSADGIPSSAALTAGAGAAATDAQSSSAARRPSSIVAGIRQPAACGRGSHAALGRKRDISAEQTGPTVDTSVATAAMERDRLARALADDESFTLGQVPTGDGSAPGKTITPTNLDDPPAQAPLQRCMLVVEAVDNGAGLPEHVMTSGKLFTPFARLQQGDACLRMSSTGLGLAIVKSMVVTDLGGAVGRMALSPVARVGSMTGKPLCLVVDDDAISRSLTARLIRSFGLDATTLDDGEAFVQHLTAALKGTASASVRWPSVVCLDSSMPKLSGPAALAKLDDLATQLDSDGSVVEAARLRSLPIIGVTGNALAGDKARFIRAGARTVVVKPVDAPLLRGSLSACLGPLMPM